MWAFAPDIAEARYYRPVFTLYLVAGRALFGLNAWAWHLASILCHLGAAAALWFLLRRLSGRALVATIGALLFAVHPTRIESVAWISGVTDPLAAVLGFCAVLATGVGRRRLALSTTLFGLALLTKETALVFGAFPLAIALADRAGARAPGQSAAVTPWQVALRTTAAWFVVALAYLAVRHVVIGQLAPAIHEVDAPVATVVALLGHYTQLLVAPTLMGLMVDPAPMTGWALLGLAIFAGGAALGGPARSLVWMGGLFLLPVLRVSTLQPDMLIQTRYLYLPAACWMGAVAWFGVAGFAASGSERARSGRNALAGLVLAMVLAGCALSFAMNLPAWEDDDAVWGRAVLTAPDSGRPWFNIGVDAENDGDLFQAEAAYQFAVLAEPDRAIFHFRLALMLVERQALHEAWHHFSRAAELRPVDPMMLYEAGRIESYRGGHDRGVELLEAALSAVEAGTIPAGGVTRADIERELVVARQRRSAHTGPPTMKWDGPPPSIWE